MNFETREHRKPRQSVFAAQSDLGKVEILLDLDPEGLGPEVLEYVLQKIETVLVTTVPLIVDQTGRSADLVGEDRAGWIFSKSIDDFSIPRGMTIVGCVLPYSHFQHLFELISESGLDELRVLGVKYASSQQIADDLLWSLGIGDNSPEMVLKFHRKPLAAQMEAYVVSQLLLSKQKYEGRQASQTTMSEATQEFVVALQGQSDVHRRHIIADEESQKISAPEVRDISPRSSRYVHPNSYDWPQYDWSVERPDQRRSSFLALSGGGFRGSVLTNLIRNSWVPGETHGDLKPSNLIIREIDGGFWNNQTRLGSYIELLHEISHIRSAVSFGALPTIIIGAGIAGVTASILSLQRGAGVHLIEPNVPSANPYSTAYAIRDSLWAFNYLPECYLDPILGGPDDQFECVQLRSILWKFKTRFTGTDLISKIDELITSLDRKLRDKGAYSNVDLSNRPHTAYAADVAPVVDLRRNRIDEFNHPTSFHPQPKHPK